MAMQYSQAEVKMFCTHCTAELLSIPANFCYSCGKELNEKVDEPKSEMSDNSSATDCLIPVTQAQVDEMDQYCELPQHTEEYAEYFEYVIANKNYPTNVKEAFDLFQYFIHLRQP